MREKQIIKRDDSTPIYLQLARSLREQIISGIFDPGNALPSERDLCDQTGMSRITIRKAIDKLIEEGLLFRKHGSGTFVAPRIESPPALTSFSEDARRRGDKPGVIWMMKSYANPTEDEASMLAISVNTKVAKLSRIRLSDGEPLAIEHAVVPARFLPALEDLGESLYEALGARGFRPVQGQQRIRASSATPTEAGIFSVAEHSEVLRIVRLTLLADGTPVEFTRSVYRGDRYEFVSDLRSELSEK